MIKLNLRLGLIGACSFALLLPPGVRADSNTSVHTTWLWHLHQPIYWPNRRDYGVDHYENAWDTIQQQDAGRPDPNPEDLTTVFDDADRVAAYQGEPGSVVQGLLGYPNAGAQMNMSGALMENVQSLAAAGQLGYASGWNNEDATARAWTTSSGKPRLDIVNFTYHHAIAPLISDETLQMELTIQQRQMQIFWGTNVPLSRGYFPAETCFSEHMIPILNKMGIAWTVLANNHLARTCPDMPIVTGSGGEMCDLPNPADQINAAQGVGNYQRISIARGCSPTQVMPFGFQLHYARYVDPNTGTSSVIILAPSDQAFGWDDSYSTWDLGQIAPLAARNNPAQPALVLCAHDGDNAWSGGYSYYNQWVPQMASTAVSDGYEPTTIEQFISDFPPPTNDIVHVEDGGWVFADSDFGSPSFINWNWPPSYTAGNGANIVDPSIGTSDKADNWRVIIATDNRVETAQQISGITPNVDQVRDPGSYSGTPNGVELGWHYYLASLDSGFVYFGCTGDECERSSVAQSNAVRNVDPIIAANPTADTTPPTVFLPQRHPWNPGGTNYGVQYGYTLNVATNTDFWIWTYAYDVSGITNVSLFVRVNGTNPPTSDQFKTYAGGPLAGAWQISSMTKRVVAPSADLDVIPQYMADYYYTQVTGITNAFVDYYVSATDAYGNTYKSPIQHVWVGSGSGGGSSGSVVTVSPAPPVAGNSVTIQYVATGRAIASATNVYLHLGWNNTSTTWTTIVSPDAAMTFNSASNWWQATVTVPDNATILNCCFNNGSGTWDNNSGANWNFTVMTNGTLLAPSAPLNLAATPLATNEISLTWSASSGASGYQVSRDDTTIATTTSTNYTDTGLAVDSLHCYSIIASNSVGLSTANAAVCTNTLAISTPQAPSAPLNLTATPIATNEINLSWSASSGASGYQVSRDNTTIATTAATNYSDTGLAADSSHCYFIIASNSVGLSTASATVCTNTPAVTAAVVHSVTSGAVTVTPLPVAGNSVTIQYTATGRAIASATNVYLHLGWNSWNPAVSPDAAMTFNSVSNWWQCTATIPITASNLNCCFNNGSGTWDNNGTSNWNFTVTGAIPSFVLDGNFDYTNYLLASSGMVLYGAVRGTTLYVATWSPGTNGPNDHFIFVSDQLLSAATAVAPWLKAGTVAVSANKPYLAGESQGSYISWFVNGIATNWPCAKSSTNSGALEGTLDLIGAFGYLPTNIYLCAAAYVTTNGGALVAECPVGSGPNLNPTNFLEIPVVALNDSWGNGTFDLCDPARAFKILSASASAYGAMLNWAAMPLRGYQVQAANPLGGAWSNLTGASNYAGSMQMQLSYTDAPPATATQRFYRIELLPMP
jgi:hypothetical protein